MATKKIAEEMINEEVVKEEVINEEVVKEETKAEDGTMTLAEVEAKIKKMLEDAEEKAREIMSGGKKEEFKESEKREIARGEEYIEVQLFKDNDKYKDDVYVAVGNQNCLIKRGVPVKVKRKFFNVLTQSNEQDLKTAQLIEEKSQKASEN